MSAPVMYLGWTSILFGLVIYLGIGVTILYLDIKKEQVNLPNKNKNLNTKLILLHWLKKEKRGKMSIKNEIALDASDNIELTLTSLKIEEGLHNTIVIKLESNHFRKLAEQLKEMGY